MSNPRIALFVRLSLKSCYDGEGEEVGHGHSRYERIPGYKLINNTLPLETRDTSVFFASPRTDLHSP
jgi:hypothetical protein